MSFTIQPIGNPVVSVSVLRSGKPGIFQNLNCRRFADVCWSSDQKSTIMGGTSMRPKTAVTFDKLTFRNMKRTLVPLAETGRKLKEDPTYAAPCHMRSGSSLITVATCAASCFEWNPEGFHHGFAKEVKNDEIEIPVVEKLLAETRERKSRVFLWGGEPLFYSSLMNWRSAGQRRPLYNNLYERDPH